MADKNQILALLMDIQHLPNSPINDLNTARIVEQYTDDLGDISAEILAAAVQHYRTSPNPFFPTSGQLREKATDLLMLSMNVPTAAEAWNHVLGAIRLVDSVWCDEGATIHNAVDGKTGGAYWKALDDDRDHAKICGVCKRGGFREIYDHPVVENVVRLLGGRDAILTENLTADRSQFIRAYNEIVARESKKATLPTAVKETVHSIANQQIKMLAQGMSK